MRPPENENARAAYRAVAIHLPRRKDGFAPDYLCTLPRCLLQHFEDRLLLCEPPLSLPTYSLSAFWHERSQRDPAHAWLRERLFELAPSLVPLD